MVLFVVSFMGASAQGEASDDYLAAVQAADDYYAKGDFINAKSAYHYASRLNPEEEYPKERLEVTVSKLRDKMKLVDEYTDVITQADIYFRQKEYDLAINKYREAASIMSAEGYPEEKIQEIEDLKNSSHRKQISYDDAIYRADKYVKYGKYEEAISYYKEASGFMPAESYPREQILLLEDQMDALVEARKEYQSIIDNGDRLLSLKYYEQAKQEFLKAAEAKPEDSYPVSMIAEIDQMLIKKNEFDSYVEKGDEGYMNKDLLVAKENYQTALTIYPSESYPKDMIQKINEALKDQMGAEELYQASIKAADEFLAAKDYTNAMTEYENASSLKPKESYPIDKIAVINGIYTSREEAEDAYQFAVKSGDQYFANGSYPEAKAEFEKALDLKPGEEYPTERLAEVNVLVEQQKAIQASYQLAIDDADALYQGGKFDEAIAEYKNALIIVPGDKFATARISEINRLKSKQDQDAIFYVALIESADQAFDNNDLLTAKTKYEEAVGLDESQEYPALQVERIDQILKKQLETTTAYNKAIATADIFYNKKEYDRAKSEYEKAASLKPSESYPKNRVAKISGMTISVAAMATTQSDGYDKTVREADGLLGAQEYAKARLVYMKAANMRPKEQYPKDKIEEIDGIVGKIEADQAEYNRLIAAADRMMESEDFDMARDRYSQALMIMPTATYPQDQLKEIENRILSNELDVQKTYNEIIAQADVLFSNEDYAAATIKYQNALKYKPGEGYPQQKLTEIETLSADLEKLEDHYSRLVAEADNLFTSKEYQEAKAKYVEASALIPEEEHPKTRIEEINIITRAANQGAQQEYDKAIAEADKFLAAAAYGQALTSYRNAEAMMPDEAYPKDMIEKIMKILNDNAFRKLLTSSKSIQNNEQEKFNFDPLAHADKKSSILLIRVRGMGIRDFKVFVNYGKGGSKSGGFIMPVPGGEEMKEYIFELGNQYNWTSKDNNWISLTPQGGSIEVSLIEIAKGVAE